jgi:hypothetical protein
MTGFVNQESRVKSQELQELQNGRLVRESAHDSGVEIAHPEGRRTIQFLGEPSYSCNS